MEYIAFDAHKHYTLASVAQADGRLLREERIEHERGALQAFLARCGARVAGGAASEGGDRTRSSGSGCGGAVPRWESARGSGRP